MNEKTNQNRVEISGAYGTSDRTAAILRMIFPDLQPGDLELVILLILKEMREKVPADLFLSEWFLSNLFGLVELDQWDRMLARANEMIAVYRKFESGGK